MTERPANRLAHETSPYLRQHAHNPVDWYPWGPEALARASAGDLPLFVSIGYAACHWCHVMERESFEDEATAALLNERFVSVKVDREERPDVDGIYMGAVQSMTGGGGWPMSVFCTPDGRPFFAGTYFPDTPRHGMPSFRQVLEGISEAWATRRDDIRAQGARITETIAGAGMLTESREPLTDEVERIAFASLWRAFDPVHGGFGTAPKFPQPMVLELCLRMAARGVPDALDIVRTTLDAMSAGGIHDQLGGGFARYSTDEGWRVPHFEKMLPDNAQLAQLYAHAWLLTREDRFRDVATRTLDYLLREMRQPGGGFSSSQDADTDGVEGKFFVWSWDELVALVGEAAARALGATEAGSWEGTNVLRLSGRLTSAPALAQARAVLFAARAERTHPGVDDKVLTAWNALAIRALAVAGRAFGEPSYVEAAVRCATFVWDSMRDPAGRLLRSWREGVAGKPGFADDHALLCLAYLTLYETTADPVWFARAREMGDALIALFADEERGGFFQTGGDAERLVVRPKDLQDNAEPSGNSAAAEALLRLALFTGEAAYERAGASALRLVRDLMVRAPSGFGHALCALDLYLGPTREVAIVGDPGAPATRALVDQVVRARFLPNVVLAVARPAQAGGVALLEDRPQIGGSPTAYVCERFSCRAPVTTSDELAAQLGAQRSA
jgi:hypothetical protein